MKAYFSTMINKSATMNSAKLAKKMMIILKKALKIHRSQIQHKEFNTFIFLSAEKQFQKSFDTKIIRQTNEKLQSQLQEYHLKNKLKLEKKLRTSQERKETSKIASSFLKEIDPGLQKEFNFQLKKQLSELPSNFYDIQVSSFNAIWEINENKVVQIQLGCLENQILTLALQQPEIEIIVDKIEIFNFLIVFLPPTLKRLKKLNEILQELKVEFERNQAKSNDKKAQNKLEMFLRILSAKLAAFQNMDKSVLSILNLLNDVNDYISRVSSIESTGNLKRLVDETSQKAKDCEGLVINVQEKIDECLFNLKGYLTGNRKVEIFSSQDDFKHTLLNIAKLSSDLYIEAETSKLWMDFFSVDIPFFAFQSDLFGMKKSQSATVSAETIISVRDLVKNYNLGETVVYALRGVNLDVKDGEFLAVVGNSGAGKTTLLNCLAGLDEPDSGHVFIKGMDLHSLDDKEKSRVRLKDMGFIFQNYALLPHFNTRENVSLPADLAGFSQDLKSRIQELLDGVGISKQAKQFPAQLSGGQLQRVAIARALTNRPKILFADEPTGDLDSQTGKQVMDLIKKFHEETKTTIIIITHEQEVANYSQRQIRIEDGLIESQEHDQRFSSTQ